MEKNQHDTVIREFKEELHTEVEITDYLGCLENIFHVDGEIGHEIIQLYSLRLLDMSLYEMEIMNIKDEQTRHMQNGFPSLHSFKRKKYYIRMEF